MYKKILSGVLPLECLNGYTNMVMKILCEDTMKLFQRLLVAPAALGLMAPLAAKGAIRPNAAGATSKR